MTVKSIYFLYISVILDIYSISFVLVNDKINFLWLLAFACGGCVVGLRPMNIWKLVLVVVDIWNLICQCNNGCDICKWVIQFNEGYTACAMVRLDGPLSTHIYRSSLTVMIIKAEIWAINPSLNSKHFWSFHLKAECHITVWYGTRMPSEMASTSKASQIILSRTIPFLKVMKKTEVDTRLRYMPLNFVQNMKH